MSTYFNYAPGLIEPCPEERGEFVLEIVVDDLRLLGIRYDGTWEIEPEDAPEAARLFAEALAYHFALPFAP